MGISRNPLTLYNYVLVVRPCALNLYVIFCIANVFEALLLLQWILMLLKAGARSAEEKNVKEVFPR